MRTWETGEAELTKGFKCKKKKVCSSALFLKITHARTHTDKTSAQSLTLSPYFLTTAQVQPPFTNQNLVTPCFLINIHYYKKCKRCSYNFFMLINLVWFKSTWSGMIHWVSIMPAFLNILESVKNAAIHFYGKSLFTEIMLGVCKSSVVLNCWFKVHSCKQTFWVRL